MHDVVAGEQKHQHHGVRKPNLARQNDAAPLLGHDLQHGQVQRDVSERVHRQEQRDHSGQEVHKRIIHGITPRG
jgi:hypothetical protein